MVTCCNFCGERQNFVIANRDRYGLPVRTAMCLNCGLVYLIDRLTADSYSLFYQEWYRPLVSRFKGYQHTPDRVSQSQVNYSSTIADAIQGFVNLPKASHLLDIGGSTGGVAAETGFRPLDPVGTWASTWSTRSAGIAALSSCLLARRPSTWRTFTEQSIGCSIVATNALRLATWRNRSQERSI